MSFLAPLFLAAASVALLPVLLHLVRRLKAKEVPFSSLMFLQATPMERIRRRKLRDILLLVLRMAMIILLATAFARPYLVVDELPFIPQRTNESVVILVDQSMSMQAGDTFERALESVSGFVDAADSGDELALIGFSDGATQLSPLSRDHSRVRTATALLAPTYSTTDFFPAFQMAEDILKDARHAQQHIVLVSDLQQQGFSPAMVEYNLPEGIAFTPIAVDPEDQNNRHFDDFVLTSRRRDDRTVTRIVARHHAFSADETVRMLIDGTEADSKSSPSSGSGAVSFQHIAPRSGVYRGSLSLESDILDLDNEYYFTYTVRDRPSIFAVSSDRDAFFLRSAFELSEESRYDFSRGNRIAGATLFSHDVAIIANPARLSEAQAAALQNFASSGGSVVLSFGNSLSPTGNGISLLGVGELEDIVFPSDAAFIGQVDAQHPIFSSLSSSSALIRPKFYTYVRIAPASGSTVLASYDNGDPLLIEKRMGQGTILVFTSSVGTSWSDLPLQELFIPLLYQMTTYATTLGDRDQQFTIGDPVPLQGASGDTWDVLSPDGSVFKVAVDSSGTGYFRETTQPGHYAAALEGDTYAFSVNVDPSESILAQRGVEETYAALSGRSSDVASTPEEAQLSNDEAEQERGLWRIAILLVLGIFALETFMAHRTRPSSN